MEACIHPSAERHYSSRSHSELDGALRTKDVWFFGGPNPPCTPGAEYWEMWESPFVSVFCHVQKGSRVTGLLGTTMMPTVRILIGVKPLVGYWICYHYV